MDDNRWAEERLSALDPPAAWRPDSLAAFARLRRRDAPRRRWWLWASVSAMAAAAGMLVLVISTAPPACANPLGCRDGGGSARPPARTNAVVTAPAYKQSGSPEARVTCELYTDFECPHCASYYLETLPQLQAAYVDTGKVRLIHRDFPLPRHRYARLAARYANAAGAAGYYQAAAARLFRTQAVWSGDGDVDGQVSKAVPPGAMEKVRSAVRDDPAPENSVAADEALAREHRVDRTPALVCNGQTIAGLTFAEVHASLDEVLARL